MKYQIHKETENNRIKVVVEIQLRKKLSEKKEYFTTADLIEILKSQGEQIDKLISSTSQALANTSVAGHKQVGEWVFTTAQKKPPPKRKPRQKKTEASSVRNRVKKLASKIKEREDL